MSMSACYRAELQIRARTDSTTTPFTITLTTTPTNNNLLVAAITTNQSGGVTVSSIVQTGVTWTRQIAEYGGSGSNLNMEIWAGLIEASGTPSTSASVTLSGSVHEAIGEMFEFSGLATSSFLDKTATNANA